MLRRDKNGRPLHEKPSIADFMDSLPDKVEGDSLSVRELLQLLRRRSLLLTLAVLTAPNMLPFINALGITHVTGILMFFFTAQMIMGRESPWLPGRLLCYELQKKDLEKVCRRGAPYVSWMEKFIKPRFPAAVSAHLLPLYGLLLFTLTFILMLPLPFVNVLPAVLMMLILLALIQMDGVLALIGAILGIAFSIGIAVGITWLGFQIF